MSKPKNFYTETQLKLQKEQECENLAATAFDAIVDAEIQDHQVPFISSRDFFFLSSVNSLGEPTVSYKGGAPGFVSVESPNKLILPNYDGNGMFYSMGNAMETGKIGMLFIDMETPQRLRLQGNAKVSTTPELLARFPGSNMVLEVDVTSVFFNCARYIHKHTRVENSKYVPNEKGEQPYPSWKRLDIVQDSLPPKDRGRTQAAGGVITLDEYADKLEKGTS